MPTQAPAAADASFDIVGLTVERAQAAFLDGTLSAEALTTAYLERIRRFNPRYNALIFMNRDALAEACAIDTRRAAGESLGPLAGIPVVVKDTMDMCGFPTTAGWRLLYSQRGGIDLLPLRDSTVVARLRAAGAIILGKTNVPVLSHTGSHANDSWAGPTYNAVARDLLPGGSSAGTATAVAAGLAVLGLGEETGGSIQNPASAQALVGLKPTFALVPTAGVMPLSALRDVVGPMARCVRDAALTLDVIAGHSDEDPKTSAAIGRAPKGGYGSKLRDEALRGRRIGTYGSGWRDQPLSPETRMLYERAQHELVSRGAVLVEDPFHGSGFAQLRRATASVESDERGLESAPYDLQKYLERLAPASGARSFREFAAATAEENAFGPGGVLSYLGNLPAFGPCLADPTRPPDVSDFLALRDAYLKIFDAVFAREQLDALAFPQMRAALTPLHGSAVIQETTVGEINIAGLPGVTVPAGYYESGAPFCLIFVARRWDEAQLLAMAYAYEQATRHRRTPTLE